MAEISEKELEKHMLDAGNMLLVSPPSLVSELLESLNLVEKLLSVVDQSPPESMREALVPSTKALISEELLRHTDPDVKVAVASCISEITRITAPDSPYEDDQMKESFQLIVSSFENLDDKSSCSYNKRISILETLAKVRSCVIMLDLECDDLIVEMFQHFFKTIRDDHQNCVFTSMETIMTLVLEESEDITVELLSSILNVLKKENKEVLPIACQLGENVILKCAIKVKPYLLQAVRSSGVSLDDYTKAVADVFQAGDEAAKPTDANQNLGDENDLINEPPEKAVEIAMETMEDVPSSEEVGPSTVGSPKTVMSNGILKKGNEDTPATHDNSKESDHDTQSDKPEPSKTIVDTVADEEPPKSKTKSQKLNRRKGRKPNSTMSSLEPFEPVLSNKIMEVVDTHAAKDVDDIQSEDPVVDTSEAAHNEKPSKVSVSSPKTSDNAHADISSPSPIGSLADETQSKKTGQGQKKERSIQEDESASDVDSKKEDENLDELDGTSAKDLVQDAEVDGSQRVNKKKRGHTKATPAKGNTKTAANYDKNKIVALPKSTPKATKDVSGLKEASRSSSKRKRPGGEKGSQTKVDGADLVGAKVEVWWPDDKAYYKGVVKSFDAAGKEHKIFYDDGDVEILNLKNEKWKLVDSSLGHATSDGESPDESADKMQKGKKAKTSADLGTKRGKTVSSTKTSGASSSKSKATPKSGSNVKDDVKIAGKSKDESLKKGSKSNASKSGNKSSDNTPNPAKSKGKSVGKSNPTTSSKVKVGTSTLDEETDDELLESEVIAEKSQGKSQGTPKSQKSSNKRKR